MNYKNDNQTFTLSRKIDGTVMGFYDVWDNGLHRGVCMQVVPEEYEKLKQKRGTVSKEEFEEHFL